MVSFATQFKFINFLCSIAEREANLRMHKSKFYNENSCDFNLFAKILDTNDKGYITPDDILEFSWKRQLNINYFDAFSILASLDNYFHGALDYEIFLRELFPEHKKESRNKFNNLEKLENFLLKIFSDMVSNLKFYNYFLRMLLNLPDFHIKLLFQIISNSKNGVITMESLDVYLQNFERFLSEQEMHALFYFFVKDAQETISFSVFNAVFAVEKSKVEENNEFTKENNYKEINHEKQIIDIPYKYKSIEDDTYFYDKTDKKKTKENKRYLMNTTKLRKFDTINDESENRSYFKYIIEEGRKVEILKQNLALIDVFNYIAAFETILRDKNLNYLTLEDFQAFLDDEENDDLYLLFEKFGLKPNKDIMMFSNFTKILAPKNEFYCNKIKAKNFNSDHDQSQLNKECIALLKNLLFEILMIERKIINFSKKINPHNFFDKINKRDKNFLREDDFSQFFEDNNFYVTKEDLKYLLHRFDTDQDGRISYQEFLSHFSSDR